MVSQNKKGAASLVNRLTKQVSSTDEKDPTAKTIMDTHNLERKKASQHLQRTGNETDTRLLNSNPGHQSTRGHWPQN